MAPNSRSALFIHISNPTEAPAASTIQRPSVPTLCAGIAVPAHTNITISSGKKNWSYFQRQKIRTSQNRIPPRTETLPNELMWVKTNTARPTAAKTPPARINLSEFIALLTKRFREPARASLGGVPLDSLLTAFPHPLLLKFWLAKHPGHCPAQLFRVSLANYTT